MIEMTANKFASCEGFLGLDTETHKTADLPKVLVIPFGLEHTVSYGGGTARGPEAIIKASHQVEIFDEEFWCEPTRYYSLATLREPQIPDNTEEALSLLAKETGAALDSAAFPLILGGEHTLTPGAIRPFLDKWPDLAILHFDAHADLRDEYEGKHLSHATTIRRCLDNLDLTVVSVGIRSISSEEIPFLEANRHRLHIHWARHKEAWTIDNMLKP